MVCYLLVRRETSRIRSSEASREGRHLERELRSHRQWCPSCDLFFDWIHIPKNCRLHLTLVVFNESLVYVFAFRAVTTRTFLQLPDSPVRATGSPSWTWSAAKLFHVPSTAIRLGTGLLPTGLSTTAWSPRPRNSATMWARSCDGFLTLDLFWTYRSHFTSNVHFRKRNRLLVCWMSNKTSLI